MPITPSRPKKWVEECIAPLVGTDVDCLLYNLCSSDGYVCQLNSGEIIADAFDQLPQAWVWRYRENTKQLIAAGANPPQLACEYGHRLGMLVIPVVRMNDMHDMFFKFELSQFKADHPEFLLGRGDEQSRSEFAGFTWGMFDYAHREVRDHRPGHHRGIHFTLGQRRRVPRLRSRPALLSGRRPRGKRPDHDRPDPHGAGVARSRGARARPAAIPLCARHPTPDACYARGLDVTTWVRDGLVDVVAPGCGYLTFSLDLKPWRELLAGSACRLVPSINKWKPSEQTRGWTKLMLARGADGVQLFNYGHLLFGFGPDVNPRDVRGDGTKDARLGTVWAKELHPDYYQVLRELGDPARFAFQNSRYVWESIPRTASTTEAGLAHRHFRAIDAIALPVALSAGQHEISFGFADDLRQSLRLGFSPRVTLRAKLTQGRKAGRHSSRHQRHAAGMERRAGPSSRTGGHRFPRIA